ncbi:5-methyltetrahydrofolate--homocysteine methyltransferase [Colwellia sp. E2M01]|uniref:5-methyltetrahydrofolate--homocysteine methyltransferase n=1 Tax=Colwellia sp. E2M01 TaxID=2841561 RepID=UPI001C08EC30|nr:5-methyltetrahydrofolate--homocysteine methyltransferase [Colwellia sp. E2M01]MBU2872173.1 5-methyltetrahydrofolate--homocysteine methyltransferase [Colwellia sp. E2M01]
MKKSFQFNLIAASVATLLLAGCNDTEGTIGDLTEIVDDHEHEVVELEGRLAVLSADSDETILFGLDDGEIVDTFSLTYDSNTLTASADYRYAVIASRANDYVGFIDSGIYQEDHGDHLHPYEEAPVMLDFELNGSSPTHIVKHDGNMTVFNDGNADAGVSASVQVLTDADINSGSVNSELNYDINMHGVAKIQGDYLLSTIRRDEAETTSDGTLPDQVGIFHLHDGEYEQEGVLEENCPDLHGAAQNHEYVAFGCTDGVLIAHPHDDEYHAEKIANIDEVGTARIGSLYGHDESDSMIGVASGMLFAVNPGVASMEKLEWQLADGVSAVSYSFSHEAEYFLVLDDAGYLNVLSAHDHDGEAHWELEGSIDISEEDLSTMPDGLSFSMTVAQNSDFVFIADPIAKHILQIGLADMSIEGDIETSFVPKSLVWLGIAEEGHDDEDGHVH